MLIALTDKSNVYVNKLNRKSYDPRCQWLGMVRVDGNWGALMLNPYGEYVQCRGNYYGLKLDTMEVLESLRTAHIVREGPKPVPRPPGRPRTYRQAMRTMSIKIPDYMIEAARLEGRKHIGEGVRRLINSGMEALGHTVPDER